MADHIDCNGKSGAVYRFFRPKEGRPLSPAGGVFLIVREGEADREILYVGETESLMNGSGERWPEAVAKHGATDLYIRLAVSSHLRREEASDLVAQYEPPMNAEA